MLITRSGSSAPKSGQPALPGPEVRRHMDVGHVQYANGPGTRRAAPAQSTRRSRNAFTSYSPAYARQPAPTAPTPSTPLTIDVGRTVRSHNQKATSETCCHTGRMSDAPSTLKERLRSDLTDCDQGSRQGQVRHDPDGTHRDH